MQLKSDEDVQRELSALENRLTELTGKLPALEAESLRLHSALLRQQQYLPQDAQVGVDHNQQARRFC